MTRTCTPEEAAALVRPRDTIGFGLGPGNPDAFLTALGGRHDWEDLVLGGALLLGYYTVLTQPGRVLPFRFLRPGRAHPVWPKATPSSSSPAASANSPPSCPASPPGS